MIVKGEDRGDPVRPSGRVRFSINFRSTKGRGEAKAMIRCLSMSPCAPNRVNKDRVCNVRHKRSLATHQKE